MSVVVRPAQPDDFDAWFAIHEAVAGEGRWIGAELPLDKEDYRVRFAGNFDADNVQLFVAEVRPAPAPADSPEPARMVGSLRMHVPPYRVAELGMAVADGWRGKGVGSALMAEAVAWAEAKGAHKITLQLWPHNTAARALYEKFGFEVEGRLRRHWPRKNGELWDALIMGLLLEPPLPRTRLEDIAAP
ncbi:MAG TPA: N-acetyltransferase [Acidimicrobiales bacterium]|nr:N-acetyltransferase [Acidimicrobiales bacterium]